MADEVKQTNAQRTLQREGSCEAVKCRDRCDAFAYHGIMDFFAMCVCGHTQQSHSLREARP